MDPTSPVPQRGDRSEQRSGGRLGGQEGSRDGGLHSGLQDGLQSGQEGAPGRGPESNWVRSGETGGERGGERGGESGWESSGSWPRSGRAADLGAVRPRRAATRVVVLLTLSLLLLWGAVTFGVAWYARDLSFDFFGWPFSFWVGAQGALLVYCLIVWTYARVMNRHEAAVANAPPEPTPSEF